MDLIVIGIVFVAVLGGGVALAAVGHLSKRRPTALDKKLPGFKGQDLTGDVAGFKKGTNPRFNVPALNAHYRDLDEDVADEPEVDLTGTQRMIDNARLWAVLERRAGRR